MTCKRLACACDGSCKPHLTGIGCDKLLELERNKYDTSGWAKQWEGACKLVTAEQWMEYQKLKIMQSSHRVAVNVTQAPITLTPFYIEVPKPASRFVAFYTDGSGASLFLRDDAGNYFDSEGELVPDQEWFFESGHYAFAYLPDDFRLFFEEAASNATVSS